MVLAKDDIKEAVIGLGVVLVLFVLVSYIVRNNVGNFLSILDMGLWSMLIYVFFGIVATVVAPVSATPLIPIATELWGWFIAGILSIIAWTIGAAIAFFIARRWGVPVVKKFISLKRLRTYEKMVPEESLFWTIVLLRIILPVDLLSYVLGIFSTIKFKRYILATIIGISPFAFIFAYVGTFSLLSQLVLLMVILIIVIINILFYVGHRKKKLKEKKSR